MKWTGRILYAISAEYRDALDRAQRAEDQSRLDRAAYDAVDVQYRELVNRFLDREKEISGMLARVRFGNSIALTPEQIAAGLGSVREREDKPRQQTIREWKHQQIAAANEALNRFTERVEHGDLNDRVAS